MGLFSNPSTPPNVAQLLSNGDAKGLSKALQFKSDPAIRRSAAEGLGRLLAFAGRLQLVDFEIRFTGLQNLPPAGRRDFIAQRLTSINAKDPGRVQAALATALSDPDPDVRANSARAIGAIWCGPKQARSFMYSYERWFPPEQFLGLVAGLSAPRTGRPILEALVRCLQDREEKVRTAAVEALEATREPSAVLPLTAVAEQDQSQAVRDRASSAVTMLSPKSD